MPIARSIALIGLLLAALACLARLAAAATGPQIWFGPLTWNIKVPGPGLEYTKYDFPALLQPDAPWQTAAARVAVLELPGNVVWSYPDLPSLVRFVKAHSFKVAFSDGMLFTGGTCGKGIEGMSQDADMNRETVTIAKKWKEAGGTLDYIDMDSPFYYGTDYAKDCHYSIDEVTKRTAATFNGIRSSFPDIHVVDAEGPGEIPNDRWLAGMKTWFAAFQQATGRPIEAVSLDLHWVDIRPGQTWQDTARRAIAAFAPLNVRTGIIINAEATPQMTDAQWMDAVRQHVRDVAAAKLNLDYVQFAEWMNHPSRNLPETDPTAYTSLINYTVQTWK